MDNTWTYTKTKWRPYKKPRNPDRIETNLILREILEQLDMFTKFLEGILIIQCLLFSGLIGFFIWFMVVR